MTAPLYDTLKNRVCEAAQALCLPLGWEGEPFVVPNAEHVRAKLAIDSTRAASLGPEAITRIQGRIVMSVAVPIGDDARAMTLAGQLALYFRRGTYIASDNGSCTLLTPAFEAPASDGARTHVIVTSHFYAHYKG